jgi:CelD/BcsL family acetyltransferase involved in cellulose biosynthesis
MAAHAVDTSLTVASYDLSLPTNRDGTLAHVSLDLAVGPGDAAWREYVESLPDALPFHHPRWIAVLTATYGLKARAVVVRDEGGTIVAGLPVVMVKTPLRGARLVSLPFTDYCPPLVAPGVDASVILPPLQAECRRVDARRAEVRAEIEGSVPFLAAGYRHVVDLRRGYDAVAAGFHASQVRRNIKRAHASGLVLRHSDRRDDLVDEFYRLHVKTRRRLGVPVQPRRFFRHIREHLMGEHGSITLATLNSRPVAAALFLRQASTVVYKYGASDAESWPARPNHAIFEHAIRSACDEGYAWFDFGRTDADAEGLRAFKRGWGAHETPLVYSAVGDVRPVTLAPPAPSIAGGVLRAVISRSPEWVCRVTGEVFYRYAA